MTAVKGLRERLRDGENVVCAEGYMWELERRGFVCSGDFTPEVVLDYPERVKALHEEFVLAGSDVVEAFTYYAHEAKLKSIGRESDFADLNLNSLRMARGIADRYGKLMAGNICNSTSFDPDDPDNVSRTKNMFKIQIEWAVQGGADYIIAETFNELAEAKLALQVIQEYGNGLPAVVTMAPYSRDVTLEEIPLPEALRQLEQAGAEVVGLNCARGPETMLPLLKEARKICKGPLAVLPACFRTNPKENCYYRLTDPKTGSCYFLPTWSVSTAAVKISGSSLNKRCNSVWPILDFCCGATPSLLREVALAYGRNPELSRFAPNTSRNYYLQSNLSARELKIKNLLFGDMSAQV